MFQQAQRRASISFRAVTGAVVLFAAIVSKEARPQSTDDGFIAADPPAVRVDHVPISESRLKRLPTDAPLFYDDQPSPFSQPPDSHQHSDPPGAKPGMLQHVGFSYTWLPGSGGNEFGVDTVALRTTLGFPFFTQDTPILVTPGFGLHLLDGPGAVDIPSRLHDAYVEFGLPRQLTQRLSMFLAVAPGIYSDFDNTSSDMIRITGRGMALWDWTPRTQLIAGVVYLDRKNVNVLPVVGLIYKPNDNQRWEITAPRPRFTMRISPDLWGYIGGELGGGAWAIRRADGSNDELTYNDLRLIVGIESKSPDTIKGRLEIGYVFARKLEFASATPDIKPDDTVMVRGGMSY